METNAEILEKIIKSRRSIFPKDYTTEQIPQEVLDKILESANYAPSHKKTNPWRFRVFQGIEKTELGETLAGLYKATTAPETFLEKKYLDIADKVSKANTVVSIVANFSGKVPEWEEVAATAMAVQNMYLTATAYNIGCYWSSPGMIHHVGDYLQLEENEKCLGFFYLGMK
ncbi:nitroreductase [Elizabethkingia meningoseptica]|uniref:nitroreductase family protein n=1 Tax=Elizabethkingia meningoseptica TaxID=238 RepID=UPI000332D695|nr:nitroreductase [Elizabethkingia meningoseptica]AQX03910.1 nitroreductase [Elizabethkingia meningoseptica]AQX45950.1 nitroreductase [Elizabethkingia meningoseptica]EOR29766.1 Nitroreductase family protein [Elizabethkingia meningoseptica ATCC 13253 = NBRC 12535]KUY15242.1 nitroreductase [Elizabethkingia meningoseptica]OPB69386.1 nitroreductase [Elizabethkingia meningoseptica]